MTTGFQQLHSGYPLDNEVIYPSLDGVRCVAPPVVPTADEPAMAATTSSKSLQFSPQATPAAIESETLAVLKDLQSATAAANELTTHASKTELAGVLEGFARVLRSGHFDGVTQAEHAREIAQLRQLLLEAQQTIITLLNDRVYDRAKLARLEVEARLHPELQAQVNRACGLVAQQEQLNSELAQVRGEIERLRTSYLRTELPESKPKEAPWLKRLLGL